MVLQASQVAIAWIGEKFVRKMGFEVVAVRRDVLQLGYILKVDIGALYVLFDGSILDARG